MLVGEKTYQIEVQLLENTADYVHVIVSADDGSFPGRFVPLSDSFLIDKHPTQYPLPPR